MQTQSSAVAPNLRVLHMLSILASEGRPMSPSELTAATGWPKQTVHRLCQTMVTGGLLERQNRKLSPTTRVHQIAAGLAQFATTQHECHQVLQHVASAIGETVNFVRPEKQGMTYVDRVETNWPFRVLLPVGTHVPFHCTASGKTFLASLPAARRHSFIAKLALQPATMHTHTTIESLAAELETIRKSGYAMDREEFHLDMVAIAVPVFDHSNSFFAALAIHGPAQRFNIETAQAALPLLKDSAAALRATIFGADAIT